MNLTVFLFFGFITGTWAKSLQRNKLYSEFQSICDYGETISGFHAFSGNKNKHIDLLLMLLCKNVDPNGKFITGDCRDAEEFEFFNGDGELLAENKFGSASNCQKGEYLAGIKSTYVHDHNPRKSIRKFQYHCCKAANAKVDKSIGCHHVGPKNPFKRKFFLLRSSIAAKSKCARDVISAVEITKEQGFTIKYCPYKVEGIEYDQSCKMIKKNIKTFSEMPEKGCICVCGATCIAGQEDIVEGTHEPTTEGTTLADEIHATQPTETSLTESTAIDDDHQTTPDEQEPTIEQPTFQNDEGDELKRIKRGVTKKGTNKSRNKNKEEAKNKKIEKTVNKNEVIRKITEAEPMTTSVANNKKITFTVREEKRDNLTVFVLVPNEIHELKVCPPAKCNCQATCAPPPLTQDKCPV